MPMPGPLLSRVAGALYLVLIACGIGSEALFRGTLLVPGDAVETASNLVAQEAGLRASILADVVMALCDVGLGAALLVLLWRAGPVLALTATLFRLAQAAILGMNLVLLMGAIPLAHMPDGAGLATVSLELHGVGYDLGLFFFAVNSVLTGVLLVRGGFPRLVGLGLVASGVVYGIGSTLVVVAPSLGHAFAAAYVIPLVAELAMAVWLLGWGPGTRPSVDPTEAVARLAAR